MQRKAKTKTRKKAKSKAGTRAAAKPGAQHAAKATMKATTRPAAAALTPAPEKERAPKGMSMTQSKGYQKLLLVKKQELAEAYNKNKNYGRTTEDEGTQDLADKASNAYTKEFLYSLSNTDREVLQKVDDALVRIANGTFGICVECGEILNKKRLEAVPWASHCLPCQEKVERGLL
ncbi:MAG TPA: TraR/DksA family transcriptional regulator [Candidatus Polarisedimenticolia bacterium]|nr:TraR/DksA family transcriptional regulator [Candidatus Polarisedimenticolia bacterium]